MSTLTQSWAFKTIRSAVLTVLAAIALAAALFAGSTAEAEAADDVCAPAIDLPDAPEIDRKCENFLGPALVAFPKETLL